MDGLRGHLPPEEPGARGIEHWAHNTDCQRLSALLFTNISPVTALTQIYQLSDHCAPSALKVLRGVMMTENNTAGGRSGATLPGR